LRDRFRQIYPDGQATLRLTWEPRMLSILRIIVGLLYMEHGLAKILGFPLQPNMRKLALQDAASRGSGRPGAMLHLLRGKQDEKSASIRMRECRRMRGAGFYNKLATMPIARRAETRFSSPRLRIQVLGARGRKGSTDRNACAAWQLAALSDLSYQAGRSCGHEPYRVSRRL